jgi:hypothetical protein
VSGQLRAKRLMALYRIRAQVAEEITNLEAAMAREVSAVDAARDAAIRGPLCGTDSGYHHHRRIQKVNPCTACKRAHSIYESGRARRQKEAS